MAIPGTPKVKAPKVPKAKPPAPYDPLGGSMPSLADLITGARTRAHSDTTAALGALTPQGTLDNQYAAKKADLTSLTDALLQHLQANQRYSATALGGVAQTGDNSAFANQAMVATGAAPGASQHGLASLGALAATQANRQTDLSNAGALSGAAWQRGALTDYQGALTDRNNKASAINAGEDSLYNKYLDQAKADALSVATARSNIDLATGKAQADAAYKQGQLSIGAENAQSKRDSNAISGQRLQLEQQRLAAEVQKWNADRAARVAKGGSSGSFSSAQMNSLLGKGVAMYRATATGAGTPQYAYDVMIQSPVDPTNPTAPPSYRTIRVADPNHVQTSDGMPPGWKVVSGSTKQITTGTTKGASSPKYSRASVISYYRQVLATAYRMTPGDAQMWATRLADSAARAAGRKLSPGSSVGDSPTIPSTRDGGKN